jgi:hypothetical protein
VVLGGGARAALERAREVQSEGDREFEELDWDTWLIGSSILKFNGLEVEYRSEAAVTVSLDAG